MKFVPLLSLTDTISVGPSRFSGSRVYFATSDVSGASMSDGAPVTYDDRPSRANLTAKKGDVLFAKMQATEKVICVDEEAEEAIFSTGFFNLRARPGKIDPKYLHWFLRSRLFQFEKDRRCTGATQKALTLSGLREIQIPIPPTIEHQMHISQILEKAEDIRGKSQDALAQADSLLQSEFVSRFGSPLTNPRGIRKAPIKELGKVITGNTPPRSDPGNFGSEIEWIKSDNINTPHHFLTNASEFLSSKGKRLGRTAPAGSTLVTCIAGSPSVIGNAAIADREVAFNQQINAVIPNDKVDPYFLYCQFLIGKKLIQGSSTNSMKGMVSKGKFQEIEFLNPSYEEQRSYGTFFQKTLEMIDRLQRRLGKSEDTFEALCQQAFSAIAEEFVCA